MCLLVCELVPLLVFLARASVCVSTHASACMSACVSSCISGCACALCVCLYVGFCTSLFVLTCVLSVVDLDVSFFVLLLYQNICRAFICIWLVFFFRQKYFENGST